MRALAWVGLVLALTILISASSVGFAFLMPYDPVASTFGTIAITVMWVTTLITGSVAFWFDTKKGVEGRRAMVRTRVVAGAFALVASAVVVTLVFIAGLAWWYAVFLLIVALALQVLAGPIAHRLGVPARAEDAKRPWSPLDLDRLRRGKRRAVVIGLVVAAVAGGLLTTLTLLVFRDPFHPSDALSTALLAADVGLLSAGIALLIPTFGMSAQIRSLFGGDLAKGRRIAKLVLRGKGQLNAGDEQAAARYAQVIPAHQQNLFGGILCVETGALLGVINTGARASATAWIFVPCVAVIVVATIIGLGRLPRARRYARDHEAEAGSTGPTATDGPDMASDSRPGS